MRLIEFIRKLRKLETKFYELDLANSKRIYL